MQEQSPPKFVLSPEFLEANGLSRTFPERWRSKVNKNGPLPDQTKYPGLDRCWVWTGHVNDAGYGLMTRRTVRMIRAHVVSWIIHFGPVPSGMCVCHACDRRNCQNPGHLWLGTSADNSKDMHNKGRFVLGIRHKGEKNGNSKLQPNQVLRIREDYASGKYSQQTIANKFGVYQTLVSAIVRREIWNHI